LEIQLPDDDAKLYSRLYVSSLDLDLAKYSVNIILKKGWHYQPWEKRGTIYLQQSVFMSALTQEPLGWRPVQPGLIADLNAAHYFEHTAESIPLRG
jgi:hypothetical protein